MTTPEQKAAVLPTLIVTLEALSKLLHQQSNAMDRLVQGLDMQQRAINNLAASNEMLANSVVEAVGSLASEEVDDEDLPESL